MFNNNVFEKKWQLVESTLEQFVDAGILPLEMRAGKEKTTITEDSLRQQMKTIHDEIFTISVCGQVKAGKSTLLNSLFFGDDVLPVLDTPMTAKLTFLEYRAGAPGFEVEFYSGKEWEEVVSAMRENNPEALDQLNDRIRFCAEKFGIYERSWIGHPPVHCDTLDALAQYVSVPEKGEADRRDCGKYTPFVKQVSIHLPHENLKNLRIVDTPGLNDSNIINSLQTTNWVRNAHAVVYVLDVTGAHEPDVRFFQQYFPGSAAEARIFVQNKIDTNPDAASVKEEIRKYGRQPIYRDLGMFGENEIICSYSGLLALRDSKIKAGKEPSEEEEFAYNFDWIDEDFDPDPDDLRIRISEKLYQRSGKIRIVRALGEFVRLSQEKLRQLQTIIEDKREQANACRMDKKKLDDKIKRLNDFCREIDRVNNESIADDETNLRIVVDKLKNECHKINARILKKIEYQLDALEHTDDIKCRIPIFFRDQLRSEYCGMKEKIVNVKKDIYRYIDGKKDELLQLASHNGIYDDLAGARYIDVDYSEKINKIINSLDNFSADLDEQLPGWLGNLFTKLSTIKNQTIKCVNSALENVRTKFCDACDELCELAYGQMNAYRENVAEWANNRHQSLDSVRNESKNKEDLQKQYVGEEAELQKTAEYLTKKIVEFKVAESQAAAY